MILSAIIIGMIGMIIVILGYLLWKKERISILHEYHYDKVSDENKKAFCMISGIGTVLIGSGLLLTAVIIAITDSAWSFIAFGIGFFAGLAFLIYAGVKYNR